MFDLTGRTAFVTGAGQGVGAAIAVCLALRGATVGVNDIQAERAEGLVEEIRGAGGSAVPAVADVTSLREITSAVARVSDAAGPVDILVHNAGIPPTGFQRVPFLETSPSDWDSYISLNLHGLMGLTHAVLGPMVKRGWGRVVGIVSDAGRFGEPYAAAYSAGKAGAAGFIRSLAKEVGYAGVNCNAVSLGAMQPAAERAEEDGRRQASRYPVGRLGQPRDVVGAVLWLVSDEASWVTGQTISVNGGYVAS